MLHQNRFNPIFMTSISRIFAIKRRDKLDGSLRGGNALRRALQSVEIRTVLGFSAVLAAVLDEFRLVQFSSQRVSLGNTAADTAAINPPHLDLWFGLAGHFSSSGTHQRRARIHFRLRANCANSHYRAFLSDYSVNFLDRSNLAINENVSLSL